MQPTRIVDTMFHADLFVEFVCMHNLCLSSLICTTLRRIVPSRQQQQHLEGQIRAETTSRHSHPSEEAWPSNMPHQGATEKYLTDLASTQRAYLASLRNRLFRGQFGHPPLSSGAPTARFAGILESLGKKGPRKGCQIHLIWDIG